MTNITEEKNSPTLEPIGCYGITITFRSPLESTTKPFHQYNYTRVIISRILGQSCVDFSIIPEFTVAGRIHYHGILKIRKFVKWVKTTLPSLRKLGFCKIETFKSLENKTRWEFYMTKSIEDTKEILGMKGSITVTREDYLKWKAKEPTIEKFVGKPKIIYIRPPNDIFIDGDIIKVTDHEGNVDSTGFTIKEYCETVLQNTHETICDHMTFETEP